MKKQSNTTEQQCNKQNVNGSALSQIEIIIVLPLIEKRYKEVDEYTIEHHELGHLIERLKSNLS
jgi:hypothetical protein